MPQIPPFDLAVFFVLFVFLAIFWPGVISEREDIPNSSLQRDRICQALAGFLHGRVGDNTILLLGGSGHCCTNYILLL